jgi:lysozyme family protein
MLTKIYGADYWTPVQGEKLAAGVDLAAFDYAVNSGPATARRKLLKVIGGDDATTVKRLCAARLASYRSFRSWVTFGKGWTRRVAAIEAKGVAWATAGNVATTLPKEAGRAAGAAKKQAAGGAGGAGGAIAAPAGTEHLASSAWLTIAILAACAALAVFLFWRASVNRARAQAYEAEAQT